MFVYLSVMFFCCILMYVMRNDKIKARTLAIVFGAIWIMVSLQEGWGGDYDSYFNAFEWLKSQSFKVLLTDDTHGEIGYKLLMSVMPSAHTGMVICLGIWCFAMAFFFYHFVPQNWWFFAIIFIFIDRSIFMGIVSSYPRMGIASSLLIFAVYFLLKNKKMVSIGLILFGSFFHTSVLFMLPLVFVGKKQNKINTFIMIGFFVALTILTMVVPSTWINLVESVILDVSAFESYSVYFEDTANGATKGLVLIILFYWISLLVKKTQETGLRCPEYLVMYYALIRIGFDLLPAFGLSTRFFYFIDIYFFAGMMVLMDRLPKKDINRWGIAVSLLLIFWYVGFRQYSTSERFLQVWSTYNFIF